MHKRSHLLAGFVAANVLVVAISAVGRELSIPAVELVAQLIVCVVLSIIFREQGGRMGWGLRPWGIMASFTVLACLLWSLIFFLSGGTPGSGSLERGYLVAILGIVLVTPWFEEKVVRHLLLRSLDGVARPLVASLAVSTIFGLAHKGFFFWAFLVSMLLCLMTYRFSATTAHRTVVHSGINAFVLALYMI